MQELWMLVFECLFVCLFVCMFVKLKNYFWGGLESISKCWNVCWFLMSEQKSENMERTPIHRDPIPKEWDLSGCCCCLLRQSGRLASRYIYTIHTQTNAEKLTINRILTMNYWIQHISSLCRCRYHCQLCCCCYCVASEGNACHRFCVVMSTFDLLIYNERLRVN